jgi:tetratricopeptide (TPR) repeat protein
VLASSNQQHAAFLEFQSQLTKTQNSRDVPGVVEQFNKTMQDIDKQWSKSPAAVAIQMNGSYILPEAENHGTTRQVDLMNREADISLDKQSDTFAAAYAAGDRDLALAAFTAAVNSVRSLTGDAVADEKIRQFRIKGQTLEINNAIANPNPDVNTKVYQDIEQHPEKYADVTKEKLDVLKGQALEAFKSHTEFQKWAEGDMALKTQLVPKIQQFTNPANGHFDEAGALTDNADRMAKGEITETQSKVLAEGFASHQAQLEVGLKTEANKRLDAIDKDLSGPHPNFASAAAKLQESQPWFENNGFGDDYRASLRYFHAAEVEVRSEASAERAAASSERAAAASERAESRQKALENSQDQLGEVLHYIGNGGMLTKPDIYSMAGQGKGKMRTQDVDTAWKAMQSYESQPDFAAAIKQLEQAFAVPSGAAAKKVSPAYVAAQNRKYAETLELFQQQVNANPDKSKQEIMNDLLKTKAVEDVKEHANAMFGTTSPASRVADGAAALFHKIMHPEGDAAAPARPKGVPDNYQWNPSGNNGKGSWRAPSQ